MTFRWRGSAVIAKVKDDAGHEVPITLDQAKRSETLTCPTCGQRVVLDGSELKRTLDKLERDLRKPLRR